MAFKISLATAAVAAALSTTAFAADLPSYKSPPVYVPPPPAFTWTGVYIGGQIGYQWGRSSTDVGGAFPFPYSVNGVTGGAHIGYNYQFNQYFVAGLEGDVNGLSYRGATPFGGTSTTLREPVDGSIRGRMGIAWDRALAYATGGVAFADFQNNYAAGLLASTSFDTGRVGWTVGGGVEYAITNNWSIRAEYRYTDYGRYSQVPFAGGFVVNNHEYDNKVQAGFSYKFDWANPMPPVIAKY